MALDFIDEIQLLSLKTSQELLIQKTDTILQLDAQILDGTENPNNLVGLIVEIKETHDIILEKINQLDTFITLHTRTSTESPSSPVMPPPVRLLALTQQQPSPHIIHHCWPHLWCS